MVQSKRLVSMFLIIMMLLSPLTAFGATGEAGVPSTGGEQQTAVSADVQPTVTDSTYVRIKNEWQDNYLYEDTTGIVRYGLTAQSDQSAQWVFEAVNGSEYMRIKNRATGHYITVEDVAARRNPLTSKSIDTSLIDDQWIVEDASRAGKVTIRSAKWPGSNYFIHEEDQLGFAEVSADIGAEWESPQWELVPVKDELPVRIYNKWKNQYLYEVTAESDTSEGKVNVGKVGYGDVAITDPASHWYLEEVQGNPGDPRKIRIRNKETGHYITQGVNWAAVQALQNPDDKSDWLVQNAATAGFVTLTNVFAATSVDPNIPKGTYVMHTQEPSDTYVRSNDWSNAGNDNAQWAFTLVSDVNPVRLANYEDISDEASKVYLYEDQGTVKYGALNASHPAYQWLMEDYDGKKRIRNLLTGHYVSAADPLQSLDVQDGSLEAQWKFIKSDLYDDFVSIQSAANEGHWVHVQGKTGSAQSGAIDSASKEAQWFVEDPTAASGGQGQYVQIKNSWNSLFLYEAENGDLKYGNAKPGDQRAQWLVEKYNGRKRIQNRATGHYMNILNQTDGHIKVSAVDFNVEDQDSLLGALWRVNGDGGSKNIFNATDLNNVPGSQKFLNVQNLTKYAEYSVINPNWGSAQWTYVPVTEEPVVYRIQSSDGSFLYEQAQAEGQPSVLKYGTPEDSDPLSHWTIEDAGGGAKYIKNRSTGHYVSMEGMGPPFNTQDFVRVMEINPDWASPKWFIQDAVTEGYVVFKNAWTNAHYMNSKDQLTHVQAIEHSSADVTAQFRFVEAPAMSPYVRIKSKQNGKYLTDTSLTDTSGKTTYADAAPSDSKSHWLMTDAGGGKKYIINRATGRYIAMEGMGPPFNPQAFVPTIAFNPYDSPKWIVSDTPEGYKVFLNGWTNEHYLSVQDDLGHVQAISNASGTDAAQFTLEGVPAGQLLLPTDYIRIQNKTNGKFLFENDAEVVVYGDPEENNAYSHWLIENENGVQRIKNRATGHYLTVTADYRYIESTTVAEGNDAASKWVIEGAEDGIFLIRSNFGSYQDEYLNTEGGLGYPERGLYPITYDTLKWKFVAAPADAVTPAPAEEAETGGVTKVFSDTNYVRIQNKNSGNYLTELDGQLVYGSSAAGDTKSHWLLQDYNGRKLIKNRSTGHLISVSEGSLDVASSSADKGLNAQWKISDILGYKLIASAAADQDNLYEDSSKTSIQHGNQTGDTAKWVFEDVKRDVLYEAEKAFLGGGAQIDSSHDGYSGTGYVSEFTNAGAQIIFAVKAPEAGTYRAAVAFANLNSQDKTLSLLVNGVPTGKLSFKPTTGENGWSHVLVDLPLRSGYNSVSFEMTDSDSGQVQIDSLVVRDSVSFASRGADLPYTTYEAEHGSTNGTIIGPTRVYLEAATEASGRQAVKLDETGQYVEFETAKKANALTLRYSIPDSADGEGLQATIGLYINGKFKRNLDLTSRYAWVYGNYPWSNDPKQGSGHRFFDDIQVLLDEEIPAGATVRLQKDAGNTAEYYIIDLVDLEQAPAPYSKPAGYISVTEHGAVANDGQDDTQAFIDTMAEAKEKKQGVWIPAGTFNVGAELLILDDITIRGAGMWHTTLKGAKFFGNGANIRVYDFKLDGELNVRDDNAQTNGFEGAFGPGSTVQNVWIEHTKSGMWLTRPINKFGYEFDTTAFTNGIYVAGGRIRNTMADGINFAVNTKNSMAEQMNVRYSGDDALAMWSLEEAVVGDFTENNTYRFNTTQLPWLANNIILFGGKGHKIQDNIVMDNITHGSGISVSTKFTPTPYQGTIVVERNTMIRAGARDPGLGMNVGALWVYAFDRDIDTEVILRDNVAIDSTYHGLTIQGGKRLGSVSAEQSKVTVENMVIDGAGLTGVETAASVQGAVNLNNVIIRNTKLGKIANPAGNNFIIHESSDEPADEPGQVPAEGNVEWTPQDNPGTGNNDGGAVNPSEPGAGSTEDPGKDDEKLEEALGNKERQIVIESDATTAGFEVELSVEAIKKASTENSDAVIVVMHGNAAYELPVNLLSVIESNNELGFDLSGSKLVIKNGPADSSTLAEIKAKSDTDGLKVLGTPVDFQVIVQNGDQSKEITRFGNTYVTRTIVVDAVKDPGKATALVYDPATDKFQYVPAIFTTVDGKTKATIKSTTNSIYLVAEYEKTFGDISNHWAREDIELLASKRIVFGRSETDFAPDKSVTRAEFATLLVHALGLKANGKATIFSDVKSGAWYEQEVNAAAQHGLILGYEDGTLKPDRTITREEMVVMLAKAMQANTQGDLSADLTSFKDADQISPWAAKQMAILVGKNIIKGKLDMRIAPQDFTTRAEAAVVIKKLLQEMKLING